MVVPEEAMSQGQGPGVPAELWQCHVRYAQRREPEVLGQLVEAYDGYALALARGFRGSGLPHDDLGQVAREALVVALHRFDPDRGLPFEAFARVTIGGALRRHIRDQGWLVRVPRRLDDLAQAERDILERLRQRLGRRPSDGDVAGYLGISADELRSVRLAVHARRHVSIDAASHPAEIDDHLGIDEEVLAFEDRAVVAVALSQLDAEDRELLRLYFFEDQTQAQIAELLGVSQMHVSRRLAAVLRRMRTAMAPSPSPRPRRS